MGKWVAPDVLDGALQVISGATRMVALAGPPASFGAAVSGKLAEVVLGAGDFALSLGGFTLGGIGTATFGAILLHALLHRGTREAKEARVTPV